MRVIRARNNIYLESTNKKLPKVGSRVRRGPDWHYGNQDSEGPGTVIGHCMRGIQLSKSCFLMILIRLEVTFLFDGSIYRFISRYW